MVVSAPMVLPCKGCWHCELCGQMTPPIVGSLIAGARHRCRSCERTVCDNCSIVPLKGVRTCRTCYLQLDTEKASTGSPREKYVFLLRHAQSTWNQNVELVNTFRRCSLQGFSAKDVFCRAAVLMAREAWNKDHPISQEGVRQTGELRRKIAEAENSRRQQPPTGSPRPDHAQGGSCSSSSSGCPDTEQERVRRYYDNFLSRRQLVYCSPLLRALQTAHLALPEEDGWGAIKLLKDARERFSFVFERDCIGTDVGAQIVERAMQMGQGPPGSLHRLQHRVDATDCAQKWWSDEPETEAEVEARLEALWRRLLVEDGDDSCVLVTHSNLIKALVMRFGEVEDGDQLRGRRRGGGRPRDPSGDSEAEPMPGPAGTWEGNNRLQPDGPTGLHPNPDPDDEDDPDSGSTDAESEPSAAWQVVDGGPEALRRPKLERLQNCGVLGLRCVLEAPRQDLYPEVDGWVDVDSPAPVAAARCAAEPRWVAKDALLMFDSVLVK
uniref:Uncharacterized protein n=1 Tax=Pyrodinium bahamense TaxID=73915 RepID=A0A7S0ATR0_9DINO